MQVFRRSSLASSHAITALAWLLATTPAAAEGRWADVAALERALDARDSATETLRLWCAGHRPGLDPSIHAVGERIEKPAPPDVARRLGSARLGALRYRRVRLECGGTTLSVADNWYRADALSAAMNDALDHTDRPFGQVVASLGLHRHPLSSERLPARSGFVLTRRAVLTNDRGDAFSFVRETYTAAVLDRP